MRRDVGNVGFTICVAPKEDGSTILHYTRAENPKTVRGLWFHWREPETSNSQCKPPMRVLFEWPIHYIGSFVKPVARNGLVGWLAD